VPEVDFAVVAPGTKVRLRFVAIGLSTEAVVARRSPVADPATRTVHCEVDLVDPARRIPVGTTAEMAIDVGEPVAAVQVPQHAASIRGDKATLFVVEGGVAHALGAPLIGETDGALFLGAPLSPGAIVVTEGRTTLVEGDTVAVKVEAGKP